jgi:hypothetical protein
VAIAGCYSGDLTEGERVLKPVRTFGTPVADLFQPMPFPILQSMLDGAVPDGNFNYWKSTFLRELSDHAIDVIVENANRGTSPLTLVLLEYYGGAAGRMAPDATAFPHRHAAYDFGICSQWTNPADAEGIIGWTRQFSDAMKPFSSGAYFLSFLDQESDDTIKASWGPNYDRLVAVKTKYDPTNFFRVNHNIRPAVRGEAR